MWRMLQVLENFNMGMIFSNIKRIYLSSGGKSKSILNAGTSVYQYGIFYLGTEN
jgi:hypothetical protein